jgi:hypothetical protein
MNIVDRKMPVDVKCKSKNIRIAKCLLMHKNAKVKPSVIQSLGGKTPKEP